MWILGDLRRLVAISVFHNALKKQIVYGAGGLKPVEIGRKFLQAIMKHCHPSK